MMKRLLHTFLAICVSVACADPVAAASKNGPLRGFWATQGYGYLIEFNDKGVAASQITAISCLPGFAAPAAPAPPGAAYAFAESGSDAPVMVLYKGERDGELRWRVEGALSDVVLTRIARKPASCGRATPDTPRGNLDVFVRTFDEMYIGFGRGKKSDWADAVGKARARVNDGTTPTQLFEEMKGLIEPFGDRHTLLEAPALGLDFRGRPNDRVVLLPRDRVDDAYALIGPYLKGPLRGFCEGQIEFGMLADSVGYLRIRNFSGYTKGKFSFAEGQRALDAALDAIFADAEDWRGLVVDVRINGGGADPYGLSIASRLAAAEYVAYEKQARADPVDANRWTPAQASIVRPSDRPGFHGPVAVLTSVRSTSAAETFVQALVNRPQTTRIGENTTGVFSDTQLRSLPNGWLFGLSNERLLTNDISYEGHGIPPDIDVPAFPPEDLQSKRDRGVEAALAKLKGR